MCELCTRERDGLCGRRAGDGGADAGPVPTSSAGGQCLAARSRNELATDCERLRVRRTADWQST
jgi:hypothetical protein